MHSRMKLPIVFYTPILAVAAGADILRACDKSVDLVLGS